MLIYKKHIICAYVDDHIYVFVYWIPSERTNCIVGNQVYVTSPTSQLASFSGQYPLLLRASLGK